MSGTVKEWNARGLGAAAVTVLLCGSLMVSLTFAVVVPILPAIAEHFNSQGGTLLAQSIMTVPSVGLILSGPTIGFLARKISARTLLLVCFLGVAAAGSAGLVINERWLFLACRVLLGFFAMGCATSSLTVIGERYAHDVRARLVGIQIAVASGGSAAVLLMAGAIADCYGWRAPFFIYLLPLLLFMLGVISLFRVQDPQKEGDLPEHLRGEGAGIWQLWPIYLLTAILAIPLNMPSVQVGFQLANDGVTRALTISVVVACFSVSLMLAAMLFGSLRNRFGMGSLIVAALLCLGGGFIGVGLSHLSVLTGAWCVVSGTGAGLLNPVLTVILLDRAAPAARAPALGLINSAFFVGELINPFILIPLRNALGVHGMFVTIGAMLTVAALLLLLWRRKGNSETEGRAEAELNGIAGLRHHGENS